MTIRNRAAEIALPILARPDTEWNQPKGTASTLIQEIRIQYMHVEHANPDKAIKITYAGQFGVMRARRIAPRGGTFLLIEGQDSNGKEISIIAPVSQCSFALSAFVPTAEEPVQKVLLGFAEGQTES
jgi:hypothetical protein